MHMRKLVPLTELIESLGGRGATTLNSQRPIPKVQLPTPASQRVARPTSLVPPKPAHPAKEDTSAPLSSSAFKDAFLAEIRRGKQTLYELAVAQARRVDVSDDRITFTFPPNQKVPRGQLEQNRKWLEEAAQRVAGRRIAIEIIQADVDAAPVQAGATKAAESDTANEKAAAPAKRDLKAEAMASSAVQAMLDVFPAEIRDVEELP
jgi:hypothetical protein